MGFEVDKSQLKTPYRANNPDNSNVSSSDARFPSRQDIGSPNGSGNYRLLSRINSPQELKQLTLTQCSQLAEEIREFIVEKVTHNGGHLGSNLGVVEATIALHRVFNSPKDILLFDTGHQGYVHKILTGRRDSFDSLRQVNGLSGYPNRKESDHDFIENSHASTALSYAHGLAIGRKHNPQSEKGKIVAFIGDGALTGGLAYEALNNLGNSNANVLIILNDNGRSYAPTVSKLSESLTQLRLNPSFSTIKNRITKILEDLPLMGHVAESTIRALTSALREAVEPHVFFEALGIRYAGPIDGHDIGALEQAIKKAAAWNGPMVLHILTKKGKGYAPAEQDDVQCLHDFKVSAAHTLGAPGSVSDSGALKANPVPPSTSYTEAFSQALLELSETSDQIVAITAAMPGPTGLLPLQAKYPDRVIDVGIAEQHAMTAAAGMAMAGLKPIVCVYSTFLSRCFDQENLDVGLHNLPVVICADRAGITGDDGPSHHGVLDMVLGLCIPNLTIFAPSEPADIKRMLTTALALGTPSLIRWPKTPATASFDVTAEGLESRCLTYGDDEIVLIGIGKMTSAIFEAGTIVAESGLCPTVFDARVIRPADPVLIEKASRARLVITAEDGFIHGGAGNYLAGLIEKKALEENRKAPLCVNLGIPTAYIPHAKPDNILADLGLNSAAIADSIISLWEKSNNLFAGNDVSGDDKGYPYQDSYIKA
ncbi:MAG: 1-deoxy-D-xylulose-5-phosphate synthase [Firmicutes bacterium]|jgi:1-deoxy-D-xylulose-5-phosphate synthase|nr:1-deoxy-D-xylulose-5-phosphate synthase [Bacillota bacterium]